MRLNPTMRVALRRQRLGRRPCSCQLPHKWDPQFQRRRCINLGPENKAYVDPIDLVSEEDEEEEGDEEEGVGENDDNGEARSLLRTFYMGHQDSTICVPRADLLERVCSSASLDKLLEEFGEGNSSKVALLDERTFTSTGTSQSRPPLGPLTARDLYQALKQPRYPSAMRRNGGPPSGQATQKGGNNQDGVVLDAEQRLIFVTDLDRWAIYALVGTASKSHAPAVRDIIYRHIALESFMGVSFTSDGVPMFQLSFALPYIALQKGHGGAAEDPRRNENGQPLRRCRDVSYLDWHRFLEGHEPSGLCFIHEAQVSCTLVGTDAWRWTGYCFVDTHHNSKGRETAKKYDDEWQSVDDSRGNKSMRPDPFTLGRTDANRRDHDPRRYFLSVLEHRIREVRAELQAVDIKLSESIREYTTDCHHSWQRNRELSSKDARRLDDKIRSSHRWLLSVQRLSAEILGHVTKTVDACENFRHSLSHYFVDLPRSHDALSSIFSIFDELKALESNLTLRNGQCADYARNLELQVVMENTDVGKSQIEIAQITNLQSVIMLLVISPVALSTQVLALDTQYIPFIPQKFTSVVILVCGFFAIGIICQLAAQAFSRLQAGVWETLATVAVVRSRAHDKEHQLARWFSSFRLSPRKIGDAQKMA